MAASPSASPPVVGGDEEAQLLPAPLAAQLPTVPRVLFHSAAATRLLFVGEGAHARSATHALLDFQFDVCGVGQIAQLLHSWHRIFVQIQQAAPQLNPRFNPHATGDEWQALLLSLSRAYRAELETCLLDAAAQLQNPAGPPVALQQELAALHIDMDDYKYTLLLLETCKSLLHLIEIFYIDPHLNVTAQLVDWTQRTLQMPTVQLTEEEEEAQAEEEPQRPVSVMRDSESYWTCVYRMLLQGRLYEALQLLESCEELLGAGSVHRALMRSVLDAIETVPAVAYRQQQQQQADARNTNNGAAAAPQVPLDQFLHSFHAWQAHLRDLRRSDVLQRHPHENIDLLLQILLGDESSMLSAAGSNYLELFLGTLLFVKPHVQNSRTEMSDILQRCMEQCEKQWRAERKQQQQSMSEEEEEEEEETLYTPIDTLRFHLMSTDIAAALSVMNTMLDLRFFLAHVVHLLDAQGEVLHHESETESVRVGSGGRTLTLPKPLRLRHSAVNDNITLLEYYLITYGETLEAASHSIGGGAGAGAGSELLWTLAADYFSACPENGRGYLTNLVRKQSLTLDVLRPLADGQGSSRLQRRVDHRRVHRLLALCTRFGLEEEYNHVLTMAGNTCMSQGVDAIRAAGVASAASAHSDTGAFGQAAHWYSMLQADVHSGLSRTGVAKLETLAELLLDQLLLQPDASPAEQQAAMQAAASVLAHVPAALLLPLEVLSSDAHILSRSFPSHSALLTVLSAFYSYRALWFRMQQAAMDAEKSSHSTVESAAAAASNDDMMDDVRASPIAGASGASNASSSALAALSLHAQLHTQCLSLLVSLVRHCDSLLDAQRKYWLPLVATLLALLQERPAAGMRLTPEQKKQRRKRRQQAAAAAPAHIATFFELQHPAHAAPLSLPPPAAAALLSLGTLTHVQRLLTSLLHSHSASLYSASVGGAAGVKQLQLQLSELTSHTIQRPLQL